MNLKSDSESAALSDTHKNSEFHFKQKKSRILILQSFQAEFKRNLNNHIFFFAIKISNPFKSTCSKQV